MKIVIDDRIPYIREAMAAITDDAVYLPGGRIHAEDVRDADALIVRTRTKVGKALIEGSKVQFVATATIGYDHIDTAYLESKGITWTACPGCNATSVVQYIHCSLLAMQEDFGLRLDTLTIGIVGYGRIGSRVAKLAKEQLGMRVLICDPPLQDAGTYKDIPFVSMETIALQSDIITFHVPLTYDGPYPTFHMADEAFFHSVTRAPFIMNASRGAVTDCGALAVALITGKIRQVVIDTWEKEPDIDRELLDNVYIGTPHIAGYSAEGKVNADNMVIEALCKHFNTPLPQAITPPPLPPDFIYTGSPLELYDPRRDSEALKVQPSLFEYMRGNYPLRRETFN